MIRQLPARRSLCSSRSRSARSSGVPLPELPTATSESAAQESGVPVCFSLLASHAFPPGGDHVG
eukprot:13080535-Alexandrium_andersonii.AAC.1